MVFQGYLLRARMEGPRSRYLLPSENGWNTNITTDHYDKLCTIEANLSKVPTRRIKNLKTKTYYYRIGFEVILLFGLTELQAQLAWKAEVRAYQPSHLPWQSHDIPCN